MAEGRRGGCMKRYSHIASSASDKFRRFSCALCCSGPIACLLVLIMALLLATPRSFAVAPGPGSVPFRFVHGFAVVVPVSVNGQGPYDFMLDTGSTITTLDSGLGQQLGLAAQGMGTVTTLTQSAPAPLAVASRVAIGPVPEENLVVMIRDLN